MPAEVTQKAHLPNCQLVIDHTRQSKLANNAAVLLTETDAAPRYYSQCLFRIASVQSISK